MERLQREWLPKSMDHIMKVGMGGREIIIELLVVEEGLKTTGRHCMERRVFKDGEVSKRYFLPNLYVCDIDGYVRARVEDDRRGGKQGVRLGKKFSEEVLRKICPPRKAKRALCLNFLSIPHDPQRPRPWSGLTPGQGAMDASTQRMLKQLFERKEAFTSHGSITDKNCPLAAEPDPQTNGARRKARGCGLPLNVGLSKSTRTHACLQELLGDTANEPVSRESIREAIQRLLDWLTTETREVRGGFGGACVWGTLPF